MSKPRSVVVSTSKHNTKKHVETAKRHKETDMNKTTEIRSTEVEVKAEGVIRKSIAGKIDLKFRKAVATISLGLAAVAASLP